MRLSHVLDCDSVFIPIPLHPIHTHLQQTSSDLANGVKLLILSATRGSSPCFVSGLTIFCVATLAIYTSFTYNVAIAMTNTGKYFVFVVYFIVFVVYFIVVKEK